jgi:hypothetical protein
MEVDMNTLNKAAWTCCALLFASASPALAAQAPAPVRAYAVPHNAFGQPDLSGTWSNASLTPQARSPLYGSRTTNSPQEVKIIETGAADTVEKGNAVSDLNTPLTTAGNVGAYNQGWIDGGSRVMRVRGEPRTSILTTPDGQVPVRRGQSPRQPEAGAGTVEAGLHAARLTAGIDVFTAQGNTTGQAAAVRAGQFDNPESRSLGERCIISFGRNGGPPMLANGFYNNNYEFVQSRDAVAINIEMVHDTRVVHIGGKHRTDGVRPWFGDSIGRYDGNTLVIETTNIPKGQNYNGSWENLKVTERVTPVGKGRLHYQFTVEDPTTWDKPWGGEYEFTPTNGRIQEYACHEGNYAMEGMLAGAREDERLDAEARSKTANRR